jgi:hypothetical protein
MRNEQFIILCPNQFGVYSQFTETRYESASQASKYIKSLEVKQVIGLIHAGVPAIEIDSKGLPVIEKNKSIPRG